MANEHPFSPAGSRQSFLESAGCGEILKRLDDGLGAREPFLLLTGEPGTGKTVLAGEAIARWGPRVTAAHLAYSTLAGAELLEEILRRFGAAPAEGSNRSKLVADFERVLAECAGRGQVAILVVDDAHSLSAEQLDELRLLANVAQRATCPFEVLLAGLPALQARLAEPALASLRQRISVRAKLEPLPPAETRRYLQHRVTVAGGDGPGLFPRKTSREIAARTGGVPRQINTLAAEALRVARAAGVPSVGVEHVVTAATKLGGFLPARIDDDLEAATEAAPVARMAATPAQARSDTAAQRAKAAAEEYADAPVIATNHEPREWVARFVGDRGPLQLGSRASMESGWTDTLDTNGAESSSEGGVAPRPRKDRGRPRSRPKHRAASRHVLTALLVAIAVATAAGMVMRTGLLSRRPTQLQRAATMAPMPAAASTAAAMAPAVAAPLAVAPVAMPAASEPVTDAVPASPSAIAASSPGGALAEGTPASQNRRYTIDVGGNIELETALQRRDGMAGLTGIQGWVVPDDASSGSWRIVLGMFRSEERANAAAEMLVNSRTLDEAHVVPLPPPRLRQ